MHQAAEALRRPVQQGGIQPVGPFRLRRHSRLAGQQQLILCQHSASERSAGYGSLRQFFAVPRRAPGRWEGDASRSWGDRRMEGFCRFHPGVPESAFKGRRTSNRRFLSLGLANMQVGSNSPAETAILSAFRTDGYVADKMKPAQEAMAQTERIWPSSGSLTAFWSSASRSVWTDQVSGRTKQRKTWHAARERSGR